MMVDQIYARALLLAGEPDSREQEVLRILCESCAACLEARLREGMTPEDCREAFVTAASIQAAAAMGSLGGETAEFKAGDLTVKGKAAEQREAASRSLRHEAERLMEPYLKDRFLFAGV